jgi:hypothetical protein
MFRTQVRIHSTTELFHQSKIVVNLLADYSSSHPGAYHILQCLLLLLFISYIVQRITQNVHGAIQQNSTLKMT